jgi:hypothetical protein
MGELAAGVSTDPDDPDHRAPPLRDTFVVIEGSKRGATPYDFWGDKFSPPDLPTGVLPEILERFALDRSTASGADVAGYAAATLAVCAAAIPDVVRLKVKRFDDWYERPCLWVGLIGLPSTKKSPTITAAVRPLANINDGLSRHYIQEKERYDAPASTTSPMAFRRLRPTMSRCT